MDEDELENDNFDMIQKLNKAQKTFMEMLMRLKESEEEELIREAFRRQQQIWVNKIDKEIIIKTRIPEKEFDEFRFGFKLIEKDGILYYKEK